MISERLWWFSDRIGTRPPLATCVQCWIAKRQRSRFAARWQESCRKLPALADGRTIPITLCLFAGSSTLPEVALALFSFVRWVGWPSKIIVGSDGTLTPDIAKQLEEAFQRLEVQTVDDDSPDIEPRLRAVLSRHVFLRKLALLKRISATNSPALYVDSDVLFFEPARKSLERLIGESKVPAFMLDSQQSLDFRVIDAPRVCVPNVNGGMLWFPKAFDWSAADLALRDEVLEHPDPYTEQTAVFIAMHANQAVPLDPRRYILETTDRNRWADNHRFDPLMACRHYVFPIRHKLWMRPLPA